MADNPFDQTNYGLRERPVSADWNQLSSQLYQTIREVHRFQHDARVSAASAAAQSISGFHGAGLRVVPTSPAGMSVAVSAGLGFMHAPTDVPTDLGATDLESVDDRSPYKPLIVQTPQTFNVPVAPSAPNSRIDIIEVRNPRRLENAIPRRQLDPNTLSYDDHVFFKTLAFQIDNLQCGTVTNPSPSTAPLSYKVGTAANPGLVPPTTPGYIKIAEVNVGNTTTSISGANIVDRRNLLGRVTADITFVATWTPSLFSGTGGSTITGLTVIAPPGIDVGVGPGPAGLRGAFVCYVTGGQIASVVITPSVFVPFSAALNGGETVTFVPQTALLGFGNVDPSAAVVVPEPLFAVTTALQPALAAQGVQVGVGQQAAAITAGGAQVTFRNASGVASQTDAKLNTLVYNIRMAMTYSW